MRTATWISKLHHHLLFVTEVYVLLAAECHGITTELKLRTIQLWY